jgi:hypothetical protein
MFRSTNLRSARETAGPGMLLIIAELQQGFNYCRQVRRLRDPVTGIHVAARKKSVDALAALHDTQPSTAVSSWTQVYKRERVV